MGKGLAVKCSVRLLFGFAAVALIAACGNEESEPSPLGAAVGGLAKATISRVSGKQAAAAQPASIGQTPRAEIEKYGIPILRVVIKSRDADALVTVSDTKGEVVTWATTDGSTFTLRNGILIQTRGLGPDLMSAQAPYVSDLVSGPDGYRRSYFFLGEDDKSERRDYDCSVTSMGKETIEIFARSHVTTHFKEECVRAEGKITNDFWIEGSMVRKSRQWTSPGSGYIEFEKAVD
jgi:Group 4 capsule polysaccharide lipoprotein gfcB, YjbF